MEDQIQNIENEEVLEAYCYAVQKIFEKMAVYYLSTEWRFRLPLDGKSREFTSPVIRTRHKNHFDFAWRLNYRKFKWPVYYDVNNATLSLLKFDKRQIDVVVRCSIEGDTFSREVMEARRFDFSMDPPIQKYFNLSDCYIESIYKEILLNSLVHREESQLLRKFDSLLLTIKVDFEFLKKDYRIYSSLKLADDMETLLINDELADVTFEIGGKELKAHKCILAVRSSVFAKMFKARGKHDDRYRIEDIEPDVFRHLLNFVYSGKTDDARSCNKLSELRLAAEKFGLRVYEKD